MSDSSHSFRRVFPCSPRLVLTACALALALAGCAVGRISRGPRRRRPTTGTAGAAPTTLRAPLAATPALPSQWWLAFGDPVLNQLQQRAVAASPDLRTAALRYAQARVQRGVVAAQRAPEIDASGGITRQRQSEYGAGTRMIDAIGGDRETLAKALSEPFTLYQAGFDASWELDLWGRVRRSIEGADADVVRQAALLDLARLTLASDLARNYFELRTAQRQIRLAREDIAALEDRMRILAARARGGTVGQLDLEQQRADLADTRAQLPPLLAQAAASINQIALLLGERPGHCATSWRIRRRARASTWTGAKARARAPPPARRPCPTWRWACLPRSPGAGPTSAPPKPGCTAPPPTSAWPRPTCIPAFAWARMLAWSRT